MNKKAQVEGLLPFVLMMVLVGLLIGVGIISLDKLADSSWLEATVYNETVALSNNTVTSFAHGNITSFTRLRNVSGDELSSAYYTVYVSNGSVLFEMGAGGNSTCGLGKNCLADYKFENHASKSAEATRSALTEVSNISSNWIGLIITIFVLAIIIALVVSSFGTRK